ncbi:MAG: KH domain-containing protein [Bacilli bacterium]|nr:KH domain-containing protein [Bacilli bacterium]
MDLVDLSKFLVSNLVSNKDEVTINQIDNENEIIIQILVSSSDIGAVIGKNGNIANAIRTLIQASAYINKLGKVRINIDSKE